MKIIHKFEVKPETDKTGYFSNSNPKDSLSYNISRRRPFSIDKERVKASPFRNVESVNKALRQYRSSKGSSLGLGFTYIASLKSMGLIPRSDGLYRLGQKYQRIS